MKNYILKEISKITIDLSNEDNLKNLPFCSYYITFANYNKDNGTISYIIFTTICQLKLLNKVTYLFIHATF